MPQVLFFLHYEPSRGMQRFCLGIMLSISTRPCVVSTMPRVKEHGDSSDGGSFTPRARRGSRAPPPVELPRPGSEAAGTHIRNNRHARCLRAPCVRCVHVRRGVRSGEARRLCVLRACVSLPIRVRPGAGPLTPRSKAAQHGWHFATTGIESLSGGEGPSSSMSKK